MKDLNSFLKKNKEKKIIVIQGLGFVGSVMSLVCANAINAEYAVIGVELPTDRGLKIIDQLNNGIFPLTAEDPKIMEYHKRALQKNNFFATHEEEAYAYADVIIIDINLDVKKSNDKYGQLNNFDVDLNPLRKAVETIGDNCKSDSLILLETTVPPGTCEKVIKPLILESLKKRSLNTSDIKIGHSYERVMPGPNYIDSIQSYFRVFSGIDKRSADAVESFLHTIIYTDEYPLTRLGHTNATEMAKVLENSYRAMNIAFMVEWSRFGEEAGINLYEVVDAIRLRPTHSNLMYPGIGVGGYCLTKDALLASWSKQNLISKSDPLVQSEMAININDQMPKFAFDFLKKNKSNLLGCRALLLGVSYRGDVGDTRFSPVGPLYDLLIESKCIVDCHDPYIQYWEEKSLNINKDLDSHLNSSLDMIIISTGHSLYKQKRTIDMILNLRPLFIFDTIGYFTNEQIDKFKIKHKVKVLGRGDV